MVRPHLTCLCVEHQNVGSCPEQLLEVFVLADLLDERRHLHRLQQQRQQPHLDEHTNTTTSEMASKANIKDNKKKDQVPTINHSLRVKKVENAISRVLSFGKVLQTTAAEFYLY